MKTVLSFLATAFLAGSVFAAPAEDITPSKVVKRADVCGQWDSITTGTYVMYNDQWGTSAATSGSQCAGVDSLSGTTIKWHTSWSWAGGSSSVKSYAQIYDNVSTAKQVSAVSTYPSTWSWTYTGSSIVADVAYDIFTYATSSGGTAEYEIMIWLAALGGAGPISSTGSAIATPTVAGHTWNLFYGLNGSTKVYSFVAQSSITSFSGDIKAFFTYLNTAQGYPLTQYIFGIAAGTEPFTGSNAVLTSTYSAVRN